MHGSKLEPSITSGRHEEAKMSVDERIFTEVEASLACHLAADLIGKLAKAAPGSQPGAIAAVEVPGAAPVFEVLQQFSDDARAFKCTKMALTKLKVTMRTGMRSGDVYPALMTADDPVFAGSAVYKGVKVAVSGFKSWCDVESAMLIAVTISFICETILMKIVDGHGAYVKDGLDKASVEVLQLLEEKS